MLLPEHPARQPHPLLPARTAHHPQGAYAAQPSALAGMDPGALRAQGTEDRPGLRHPDYHDHQLTGPSPAGLPVGAGHPALGKRLRQPAPKDGLLAGT